MKLKYYLGKKDYCLGQREDHFELINMFSIKKKWDTPDILIIGGMESTRLESNIQESFK